MTLSMVDACSTIAILIDISGSMFTGNKYKLAVQTATALINSLTSSDKFAVMVYADKVVRLYPSKKDYARATSSHKQVPLSVCVCLCVYVCVFVCVI